MTERWTAEQWTTEQWMTDDAFRRGLPVVAPGELFFSITDPRGVIEQANSVFVRLSGFARGELLGAPHNVIRHPVMPAGVFRIMWDLLHAGRPVAAYTTNRSRDGRPYSVFATITPLGDRMLSVRSAPSDDGLRSVAESIYREVLVLEQEAAAAGRNRRDVAELGAVEIGRRLAAAGFAGYEDFVRHAVPAEALARVDRLASRGDVAPRAAGRWQSLGGAVDAIDGELAALWHTLGRYQELADQMLRSTTQVREAVHGLRAATQTVADASERVLDRAPVLTRSAEAMTGQASAAQQQIGELADQLIRVHGWLLDLRYRIALTRLHNDMVRGFLTELVEGSGVDDSRDALPLLCAALDQDATLLAGDLGSVAELLADVGRRVDTGSEELRALRRGLSTWRLLVPRYGVARDLDGRIGPVDLHLDRSHDQLGALAELARACAAGAVPTELTAVRGAITTVRREAAGLAER